MKQINYFNYFFFILVALIFTIFFIGQNNFWFNSTDWLYGTGDLTNAQLGWKFFKEDEWRFPIGKNPNYGLEVSNSIVFSDSIPLFALIFKLFNKLLIKDFQYMSLWIFLNFFLQLFFSFLLIQKFTKDIYYSYLGCLLFVLCPFMLFRLTIHLSLGAHWLILFSFYILYFVNENKKENYWSIIIFLSIFIHLYFTVMLFIIYLSYVFEKIVKFNKFKDALFELTIKIFVSFLIMYIVGYFESSLINSVSTGYGYLNLDIFGFFDPKPVDSMESWSLIMPDIKGNNIEGFNYLGFGNIILVIFSIFFFLIKKNKTLNNQEFKVIRICNIYLPILLLWSLTTNISFMGNQIVSIELPKYIFGALSIFAATGRFVWPVIYFFVLFSIIFIYKNFSKKISYFIIVTIIFLQIFDISKIGRKNLFDNSEYYLNQTNEIWEYIDNNFNKIRTTYHFNNYGPVFTKFSKILSSMKNIKTDIVINAAMDRKKSALLRYDLINKVHNKQMSNDTAYIIDNKGHLIQLKHIFEFDNHGFVFRDDLIVMLPNTKKIMNEEDVEKFSKIRPYVISFNKRNELNFKDEVLGFGWSHNHNKKGVWSEGNKSFILMALPKKINRDLEIEFSSEFYKNNNNKNYELRIYANNIFIKKININENKDLKKIILNIMNNQIKSNILELRFEFDGLRSPYENFESPDARKLGVLLKDFIINEKL